jgi:effector-binding domain-containing protein
VEAAICAMTCHYCYRVFDRKQAGNFVNKNPEEECKMSSTIELIEQEPKPALSIRTRTTLEDLPGKIAENYSAILDYMHELGVKPVDAPFTAYYGLEMKDLDVEMGFPVNETLPGKDNVTCCLMPSGKAAAAMYKGPYSGMEKIYEEMFDWIIENEYESTGVYYEYYLNSPDEVPVSELLTRIIMPLK